MFINDELQPETGLNRRRGNLAESRRAGSLLTANLSGVRAEREPRAETLLLNSAASDRGRLRGRAEGRKSLLDPVRPPIAVNA